MTQPLKRKEIVPLVETWMDLGIDIETEVGQTEKNQYHTLTHIGGI